MRQYCEKKGWNDISVADRSLSKFSDKDGMLTVKISCVDIDFAHFGFDLWSE